MISGLQGRTVKRFLRLKLKKHRDSEKAFLIEGIHLVDEALRSGRLREVIYSAGLSKQPEGRELIGKLIASGIDLEEATESVIRRVSDVETPQGIIAVASRDESDLGDLFEHADPLILVASGIQDPGNLGTMIRTAAACGCSGLVMTDNTVDAFNDKTIRASSGAIFRLNLIKFDDIIELISSLKRRGVSVISAFADGKSSLFDRDLKGPLAVIIGSEARGLSEEVRRLTEPVFIPMAEGTESLNAAVSGAIILYEAVRQRRSS